MRILGPIVLVHSSREMAGRQVKGGRSGLIGTEPVGDDACRTNAVAFKQNLHQFACRARVAALLHKHVEHFAFIIDSTSQIHALTADPHHHLIKMPARRRLAP